MKRPCTTAAPAAGAPDAWDLARNEEKLAAMSSGAMGCAAGACGAASVSCCGRREGARGRVWWGSTRKVGDRGGKTARGPSEED